MRSLGALAVVATVLAYGVADACAGDRVYWGGYGGGATIAFAGLDGSGGANLVSHATGEPLGLAIDAAAGRVYWVDDAANVIEYANLDGGGEGTLAAAGATLNGPAGAAIDPVAGRIYWANASGSKISYARLDGSGGGDLDTTGATVNGPQGVAVDPEAGRIYWANYDGNSISYARLDGTGGGGDLHTTGATITNPSGLAIDKQGGRLYWTNWTGGKVAYANLDGSGGGDLDTTGATATTHSFGVAIDHQANRVYWASYSNNTISFADLDGTGGGGDVNTTGATLNGPAAPVLLRAPSGQGAPDVTGGDTTGAVLSCSQGSWAPDVLGAFLYRVPSAFRYQWSLDGSELAGATSGSYSTTATGDYRCTVTASNAAGSAAQTSAPHTITAPPQPPPGPLPPVVATLSGLRASRTTFRVGHASTPLTAVTARRHRRGTTFRFTLDRAAKVKIVIRRRGKGKGRRLPALTRIAHAGVNKVAFSGRIRHRALRRGRYRATFTASNEAGSSKPKSLRLRIVRR